MNRPRPILVVATQGSGSGDERRLLTLMARFDVEVWSFDTAAKRRSASKLLSRLLRDPPRLLVIEGSGVGVCVPAIVARLARKVPYVVSSGDAVGPFIRLQRRELGLVGGAFERVLCRLCTGFIAWTPYLAGRAMTFGAPAAITAPNWAGGSYDQQSRQEVRRRLEIPDAAVVFGLVGSLTWSEARQYCYGLELIRAVADVDREDVRVLIVGDGTGRARLEALAGADPRIRFTGAVDGAQVPGLMSAMDWASLPQSRDGVGMFRYTTKLSEYLAVGVPIVTGRLPFAYDMSRPEIHRIAGSAPWDPLYVRGLAALMQGAVQADGSTSAQRAAATAGDVFDRDTQQDRVTAFIMDVLDELDA